MGKKGANDKRTETIRTKNKSVSQNSNFEKKACFEEHNINPSNAELNPICHLLALLGAHHIFHVSWINSEK